MDGRQRQSFDAILEEVLDALPPQLRELIEEVPVIAEDEPSKRLLREMAVDAEAGEDLLGLHSGIPLTGRSVEHSGTLPETITLYRRSIIDAAAAQRRPRQASAEALRGQILTTLLHEIGHHFGLDERELRRLGYG